MSFDFTQKDLEEVELRTAHDAGANTIGTYISAVGLGFALAKNKGILEMHYQGSKGATAQWKLNGLGETSGRSQLYASVGIQACMKMFPVEDRASNDHRLISPTCKAGIRAEGVTITLLICQGRDGTRWTLKPDDEGRRPISK